MGRKYNRTYHYEQLELLKNRILKKYPWLIGGFFIRDFDETTMKLHNKVIEAVSFEIHGEEVVCRTYRKSDTPEENMYDVDQYNYVNRPVITMPSKRSIVGHHINHTPEEDFMKRNQMLFELTEVNGELMIKQDENGFTRTFINFADKPNRIT